MKRDLTIIVLLTALVAVVHLVHQSGGFQIAGSAVSQRAFSLQDVATAPTGGLVASTVQPPDGTYALQLSVVEDNIGYVFVEAASPYPVDEFLLTIESLPGEEVVYEQELTNSSGGGELLNANTTIPLPSGSYRAYLSARHSYATGIVLEEAATTFEVSGFSMVQADIETMLVNQDVAGGDVTALVVLPAAYPADSVIISASPLNNLNTVLFSKGLGEISNGEWRRSAISISHFPASGMYRFSVVVEPQEPNSVSYGEYYQDVFIETDVWVPPSSVTPGTSEGATDNEIVIDLRGYKASSVEVTVTQVNGAMRRVYAATTSDNKTWYVDFYDQATYEAGDYQIAIIATPLTQDVVFETAYANMTILPVDAASTTSGEDSGSVTNTPEMSVGTFSDVPATISVPHNIKITLSPYAADSVSLWMRLEGQARSQAFLIGKATDTSGDGFEWRYPLDPTLFENGSYILSVEAERPNTIFDLPETLIKIATYEALPEEPAVPPQVDAPETTDTKVPATSVSPSGIMAIRGDHVLRDGVRVFTDQVFIFVDLTEQATEARLYLYDSNGNLVAPAIMMNTDDKKRWSIALRKQFASSGLYRIRVEARNATGKEFEVKVRQISIFRDEKAAVAEVTSVAPDNVGDAPKEDTTAVRKIEYPAPERQIDDETIKDLSGRIADLNDRTAGSTSPTDRLEHYRSLIREARTQEVITADNLSEERKLEGISSPTRQVVVAKRVAEKEGIRMDSDNDGISDFDERYLYHTNPFIADSDNDGMNDGDELMAGRNPIRTQKVAFVPSGLALSTDQEGEVELEMLIEEDDQIMYEDAKTLGPVMPEVISLRKLEVTEVREDESGAQDIGKLALGGNAPALSFVTLYIYSQPIIVTVRADESGFWSYEFNKTLADGEHEVYAAITDANGAIYAKSNPVPFVKEAQAVSVNENALLPTSDQVTPSFYDRQYLYTILLLLVVIVGWALILMGSRRREQEFATEEAPGEPSN